MTLVAASRKQPAASAAAFNWGIIQRHVPLHDPAHCWAAAFVELPQNVQHTLAQRQGRPPTKRTRPAALHKPVEPWPEHPEVWLQGAGTCGRLLADVGQQEADVSAAPRALLLQQCPQGIGDRPRCRGKCWPECMHHVERPP